MDERTRIRDHINRTADRNAMLAVDRSKIDQIHRFDSFFLTAVLACVAFATLRGMPIDQSETQSTGAPMVLRGIDPETASWAELALLPGLGESASTRIIGYRETWRSSQPGATIRFFRAPPDLQKVKGIGDKTVRRIRSFLRFPKSAPDPRH
jgi:hypothetical protein